ncbi:tripartite tricarboxylate transporter TctB family protein [Burkholderiaceae bacterium FT117]|uniref:tripartite tricarboxylate transporter TctB family protein n=1 Tax=Zeimonas sediminis TaxID=2944268 RepID=UPI0023430DD3|nr:tripartite tricarboxylate transporter TctB family protein [Zeimonas sediminis]MCM5569813.1 tripartite tricarboxylate transporter TctB family protein [Zeimonas sediminis]
MPNRPAPGGRRGPLAMAAALLALAAVAGWQVWLIPPPPVASDVGPSTMPGALAGLLAALSFAYLVQAWRGDAEDAARDPVEGPLPGARGRLAWLAAGLAAMLGLLPAAGIGPASAACFVLVARAFDSRRWLRDAVAGAIFAFAIWFVFDRLLGVQLGPFLRLGG